MKTNFFKNFSNLFRNHKLQLSNKQYLLVSKNLHQNRTQLVLTTVKSMTMLTSENVNNNNTRMKQSPTKITHHMGATRILINPICWTPTPI